MASAEGVSSPGSGLSSPPHSPQSNGNNSTIRVASTGAGVAANANTSSPTPATAASTSASAHTAALAASASASASGPQPRLTAAGTIRKKPGPKPKPKDPNAPEKRPRKPRKTVELREAPIEPATRKRRTKASLDAQAALAPPPPQPEEQLPFEPLNLEGPHRRQQQQEPPPLQHPSHQQHTPTHTPQSRPIELASVLQPDQPIQLVQPPVSQGPRVLSNPEPIHNNPSLSHINAAPSTPRPASSGQLYDPIRGGIMFESKPHTAASAPPPPISPPLNRASASPSITSLIDPPSAANSSYPQTTRLQHHASVTSAPASPAISRPASVLPHHDQQQSFRPMAPTGPSTTAGATTPMEIDSDFHSAPKASVPMKKTDSSAGTPSHSNAPTPPVKAQRNKEAPPPLPTGSGLLSGTPFGPAVNNGSTGSNDVPGVNIWLTFPLKGQANVTINFAQEVEKKYGFAALHPKIAARKERLRQVTAAGAAIERAAGAGSADDMSLDLSEPDSNIEMGGMDDEGSAAGNGAKKKTRKRKQEDYDKDDDFIDDTELAWEQQALMAKDGFFVYSGPLLTEGEKPTVERPDGTVKRGRGRGRGGTVRGETSGRGRGRGGGPGSRGGSTVRKPRVTKADRAMMEQEKHEREKLAQTIAAKQPMAYASTTAL